MGQRSNYAAVKDVPIKPRTEECALSMVQKCNYAALRGAQRGLSIEECAGGMGQSTISVVLRDAPNSLRRKGFALHIREKAEQYRSEGFTNLTW